MPADPIRIKNWKEVPLSLPVGEKDALAPSEGKVWASRRGLGVRLFGDLSHRDDSAIACPAIQPVVQAD
jgi:hypothetical protein